jgi:hypothetical protein
MKALELENLDLQRRLERLKNLSKKVNKRPIKNYLSPEKKQESFKHKQKYENIGSIVNYKSQKEYQDEKYWRLYQKKVKKEMKGCTFTPKLNETSQRIIQSQRYIRPQDKQIIKKKQLHKSQFGDDQEISVENSPKREGNRMSKKPRTKKNNDFYKRQINWLKKKKENAEKKRLNNLKNQYSNLKPKMSVRNFDRYKVNKKNEDFLVRMENEKIKSKKKKTELINKFQSNSFKPVINKNYMVKSRVFDSISK